MSRTWAVRERVRKSLRRVRIERRAPIDCGKVRYATFDAAVAKAIVHVSPEVREPAKQLQPYECRRCNGWHLTSKPWRNTIDRYPVVEAS